MPFKLTWKESNNALQLKLNNVVVAEIKASTDHGFYIETCGDHHPERFGLYYQKLETAKANVLRLFKLKEKEVLK